MTDTNPEDDPGVSWHPTKRAAYDDGGNLRDLTDDEVLQHAAKMEALNHPDSALTLLEAEDSAYSPEGTV